MFVANFGISWILDFTLIMFFSKLANRYITDRKLPDSALDVIDLSGTYTCFQKEPDEIVRCRKRLKEIDSEESAALNRGDFEFIDELNNQKKELKRIITDFQRDGENSEPTIIDEGEIAETISEITGIPIAKLSSNEKKKIAEIDKVLKQSVIGQDEAINVICKVIKRNKVGLGDKTKTMGNFLMLGESGCGKCISKNTKIKIRNKKTLETQELTIEEFIKLTCSPKK